MGFAWKAVTTAMDVFDVASTYKGAREEGSSSPVALAKTVANQALWATAPALAGLLMAKDIGGALVEGGRSYAKGYGNQLAKAQNRSYRSNFGGNFIDTQNAYTMRQRSTQAMEQSGMNIQQVLGSEARTYYRGL